MKAVPRNKAVKIACHNLGLEQCGQSYYTGNDPSIVWLPHYGGPNCMQEPNNSVANEANDPRFLFRD